MRIEIPIYEVQQFLNNYYNINIELKNIATDQIQATYFESVVLILKEINEDEILFNYDSDGLVNILAKITHFFVERKLENIPIEWNTTTKAVAVNLRKIPELNEFLKFVVISKVHFTDDNIIILMFAREKQNSIIE